MLNETTILLNPYSVPNTWSQLLFKRKLKVNC